MQSPAHEVSELIPAFPRGATIESIFLANYWLRQPGSLSGANRLFYGKQKGKPSNLNPYGLHANAFSQRVLGGKVSGQALVQFHSAWPVYSSVLPRDLADKVQLGLTEGRYAELRKLLSRYYDNTQYVDEWRICPACCAQDVAVYGVGHWRVVHQLPGVTACPTHQAALLYRCADCAAPLGGATSLAMPGWPCMVCGSEARVALLVNPSPGARALACLYSRLVNGDGPDLQPVSRAALHERVLGAEPSDRAVAGYIERFRSTFGCDRVEQLGSLLNSTVTLQSVISAVRGGIPSSHPIILALAAFAEWYASAPEFQEDAAFFQDEARRQHVARPQGLKAPGIVELCDYGVEYGVPKTAILARIDGVSVRDIRRRGLASAKSWRKFYVALPERLRCLLPQVEPQPMRSTARGLSFDEKRKLHRSQILSKLEQGKTRRRDLVRECSTSWRWCLKNDAEWFERAFPPARRGPRTKRLKR